MRFVAAAAKARQPLRTVESGAHAIFRKTPAAFEKCGSAPYPCTKIYGHTRAGCVRFFCDTVIHETRFCESKNGVRRSSRKGASAFADCGVGSTRNFSQNARSVRKMRERTVPLTKSHTDTPVWVVSVFSAIQGFMKSVLRKKKKNIIDLLQKSVLCNIIMTAYHY